MKIFNFTEHYDMFPVQVEIIGETKKSFRVKLLQQGPKGEKIGTMFCPRKRNVININYEK